MHFLVSFDTTADVLDSCGQVKRQVSFKKMYRDVPQLTNN